jgi:hypothetical protein
MYNSASGAIDNTVRNWVHDLINGLYGFLHMIFGDIGSAWNALQAAALGIWHTLEKFSSYVALAFHYLFKVLIPAIIAEYRKLYADVMKFATSVYDYAVKEIDRLGNLITSTADALWQLILRDIYDPLFKIAQTAIQWIQREGALVLYYIQHPDKLVELFWNSLIAKLEAEAWDIGALLGKFFLSLVVRNLPRFAALLETILDAIL